MTHPFRCDRCGRFVNPDDPMLGFRHTPDAEGSREENEVLCASCDAIDIGCPTPHEDCDCMSCLPHTY